MAITIVQAPGLYEPVYSTIPIVVNSTSASTSNYKYVFDTYTINQLTAAQTLVARCKFNPRPDGTCIYSPARILENYLTSDLNAYNTGFTSAQNSIVQYQVFLGEEYPVTLQWTSTTSASTGYVQLNFDAAHGLLLNDSVYNYKLDSTVNSQYNGYHTINSVPNTSAITINVSFGTTTTGETGYIKSLIRILSSPVITGKTAINFARQYNERTLDIAATYISSGSSVPFLTNRTYDHVINDITIGNNDAYTLSLLQGSAYPATQATITTYNSSFVAIGNYSVPSYLNPLYKRIDIGCGTYNLARTQAVNNIAPFTLDYIYNSNVKFYKVEIDSLARSAFFQVISTCSKAGTTNLAWLNRLGGFDYYFFNNYLPKEFDVKRTEYTKTLDYNYAVKDRGRTALNINVITEKKLQTEWLSEDEATWLQELFTSPEVYITSVSNLNYVPIIIIDKNYTEKTYLSDRLIQYTFTYQLSNDLKIQRG